jgi:hypothetical protein
MILFHEVCIFPPFRQKKGERMGHGAGMVSQKFIEEQQQILRLTTPRLKSTPGAPFAQDDSNFCDAYF